MTITEIIGVFFIIIGVIFSVLGVIGILRFPDTYSRLHATGKVGTLGVIGLCVGVGVLMPEASFKLLALSIFIIFSGPVASHAIAVAVKRGDLPLHPVKKTSLIKDGMDHVQPTMDDEAPAQTSA